MARLRSERETMSLTRRETLRLCAAGVASAALFRREEAALFAASKRPRFKVGVTDWNLKQEGKPDSVALARRLGFDGVQVIDGVGTERQPLGDTAQLQQFIEAYQRAA